jgi:hypothetical protein
MRFSEDQNREIEEALRHLRDMDRALIGSQIDFWSRSSADKEIKAISEAGKLSIRNAIQVLSITARHAIERTVTDFHAFAVSSVQRAAIETLQATEFSRARLIDIAQIRNATIHTQFAPSMAALESTLSRRTLEEAAQAIAEANRFDISKLGAISGSSALAALDFSKFDTDLEYIQVINNSYSGQVATALRDLLSSPDISEDTLKPVRDLISSKINSLPQGRISAEGLLTLILTLITALIAYGSYESATNQPLESVKPTEWSTRSAQIRGLIQQLVTDTSRLIPVEDPNTYCLVERIAELRLKPRAKAFSVGSLFPNQRVRIVERSHKWIHIEYFDEIEGVPRYGWAYKKYFRPIPLSKFNTALKPVHGRKPEPSGLSNEERLAITDNWEETNARRVGLIHKKIKNEITATEERELEHLQHLTDERIRLVAPLPINHFKTVLDEVTRSNSG